MDKKELPKVIVFEGGDVCGKTTQLENVAKRFRENGQKVYTFKFPAKYLYFNISRDGKDLLTDEYISMIESLISQNVIRYENDGSAGVLDIYSIFDALHKYLFNSSTSDIIDNWKLIKKLIISDILLNGINKFIWIGSTYNDIVKNAPDSIILIDRFMESGNVYNDILPRTYLREKFKYCKNEDEQEFFNKFIEKDLIIFRSLSDKVSNILDASINMINRKETLTIDEFKCGLTNEKYQWVITNVYNNFVTLIFESSSYLYNEFKSNTDNVNREVSQYDTNNVLRQIVSHSFVDRIDRIDRGPYLFHLHNTHKVDTDLMISYYKSFYDGNKSCIDFCTDILMEKISLCEFH